MRSPDLKEIFCGGIGYVLPDEIKGEYIKGVTRENIEVVWAENAAINFCKSKGGDKWKELSN